MYPSILPNIYIYYIYLLASLQDKIMKFKKRRVTIQPAMPFCQALKFLNGLKCYKEGNHTFIYLMAYFNAILSRYISQSANAIVSSIFSFVSSLHIANP